MIVPSLKARQEKKEFRKRKGDFGSKGEQLKCVYLAPSVSGCKVEMKTDRRVREKDVLLRDLKTKATELTLGGGHIGVGNTAHQIGSTCIKAQEPRASLSVNHPLLWPTCDLG